MQISLKEISIVTFTLASFICSASTRLDATTVEMLKENAIKISVERTKSVLKELCDPVESIEFIEQKLGYASASKIQYGRIIEHDTPLPAITGIVKFNCVNKIEARKSETYVQFIVALDREFSMWRCQAATNITIYEKSSDKSNGYKKDTWSDGSRLNQVAELSRDCKFN